MFDVHSVEPAFQAAIEADPALIRDAMDLNIMLVSPTIRINWHYVLLITCGAMKRQNQNAKEIAERASKLYDDKLRLFVNDAWKPWGSRLEKANQSYQGAMNGCGNE